MADEQIRRRFYIHIYIYISSQVMKFDQQRSIYEHLEKFLPNRLIDAHLAHIFPTIFLWTRNFLIHSSFEIRLGIAKRLKYPAVVCLIDIEHPFMWRVWESVNVC